jgi:imidazolonepropionase-like amidohydrolase
VISNGKITAIGKGLKAPEGGKVIDATGMHLTSGIIDEHSHTTISGGGNESGQAISAEVSIGDIINSETINIYRQLAGGVTCAQILHGSANPIGGQSGLIKFRWGLPPEQLKIQGADGFIKFALGENVKQSNWGDRNTVRYPQSRMGVEQVYYDAFIRAKEYDAAWKKYNRLSKKRKEKTDSPRRDLELDILAEILNKKRFITCHSYEQGEINMLMHVADSMGFRINTFTHILEGYKVADKMKAHGVGASTFSDWWAYKFEVNDAIPYNGAILDEMGVITAYNSDDSEMARRLNQEAAKAVKYGGVSQENAWKFVTLNPARLLHLDDRVGSIKVGKDADVVLWTDNPLSVYAKVKQTYVDGVCYYDAAVDVRMRSEIRKERARLIQKMMKAKKGGSDTQKPKPDKPEEFKCHEH